MLDIRTVVLLSGFCFTSGAVVSGYLVSKYKDASWSASIESQKVEAVEKLKVATDRAILAERRQNELSAQLEVEHVESEIELSKTLSSNRRLVRELSGLRDPGRRPSCGGSMPIDPTTTAQSETGSTEARLSTEASDFLLELAYSADRAAQYAQTCYDWIRN